MTVWLQCTAFEATPSFSVIAKCGTFNRARMSQWHRYPVPSPSPMSPRASTKSHAFSIPRSLQQEAESLAEKVSFYCNTATLSIDYLRSDIPRRNRMMKEFEQSPNAMKLNEDPQQDPLELLKAYDLFLAKEPVTFEDHFYRATYAFSAFRLYDVNVVHKLLRKDPRLHEIYDEHLTALEEAFMEETYGKDDSETSPRAVDQPLPTSTLDRTNGRPIAGEQAAREILRDHAQLMRLRFILSAGTEDEGDWRVDSVTLKADGKTEYAVKLSDCPDSILLQHDEVVTMLCDSVIA